jgi:hypothetical protein
MSLGSRFAAVLTAAATLAAVFAHGAWATHSRPGSATPIRAPLVPAYAECTSPNSSHVLPLPLPSCDPPARVSDVLATGSIGQGSGSVRLTVFCYPPEMAPGCTHGDGQEEQDIAIDAAISDVRCLKSVPGCSGVGGDYTGSLIAQMSLRLTDHDGGGTACTTLVGAAPCVVVTVQDARFGVLMDGCLATGGPAGATCNLSTTVNAKLPGLVKEGERMVASVLSAYVTDLGEDGDAGPNCPTSCGNGDETTFLDTGLFLP